MKKLFATLLFVLTFSQSAWAYPAANMDEGYLYWSQRYSLENVSPLLCLSDSAASLNSFLLKQSLNTDIAEELERISFHIESLNKLFKLKNAHGKKMDFILQELFREVNTLSAKLSKSVAINFPQNLNI